MDTRASESTQNVGARALGANLFRGADGAELFYRDWGTGKPMLFVAPWGQPSDIWRYQMYPFSKQGYRCIAFDRRGHGRSSDPGRGYDVDTLADDIHALMEHLDLRDVTIVSHSIGTAETTRYLARHGSDRVKRVVMLAPIPPCFLQGPTNPTGAPRAVLEEMKKTWVDDYPRWLEDNSRPYVMPETSDATIRWIISMMLDCSLQVIVDAFDSIFSTDFRDDLRGLDVPVLLMQGTKDASWPIEISGHVAAKLIPNCTLKVYEGAPHGFPVTHAARVNSDILSFLEAPVAR